LTQSVSQKKACFIIAVLHAIKQTRKEKKDELNSIIQQHKTKLSKIVLVGGLKNMISVESAMKAHVILDYHNFSHLSPT